MATFNVQFPDGSVRSVQGTTLSAAINNAGAGASAPSAAPSRPASSATNTADVASSAQPASGGAPTYQTVNGPKTVNQMYAELQAAGWPGPANGTLGAGSIADAYAQTAGGSVTEMAGQSYGAAAQTQPVAPAGQTAQGNLGDSIDKLLAALASGNQAAAAEAARQFNATFGLDQNKFQEAVRQYNQNFGLQQAAVTGSYNGQATLAKQKQDADLAAQAAGLTGFFNGQETLAHQKQGADILNQERQTGLDALKVVESAQADPFRQQQVINGLSAGGYTKAIDALNGNGNQPSFQAPTGSAADSVGIGAMRNRIAGAGLFNPGSTADGGDPVSGAIAGSAGNDNAQMQASLAALPNVNKIVGRNFLKEDPATQQFTLSGESAKNGLSMDTNKAIIQSTMPKFEAPTGMVA
ncbi:MAG: hypothetical protein E6J20_20485 [Chloroflexi bacterium]|nr:MAG: hypothetical protein E6J20_20485 [Chloroflexota bacterium]